MNSSDTNVRPTRIRYTILALLSTLAMITYLDRAVNGSAKKDMMEAVGRGEKDFYFVLIFFQLAYAMFEIPSGWMGDTYGPRKTLIRIVIWWSAFIGLTAFAGYTLPGTETVLITFGVLIALQFFFGMGEAGAFPNISRALYNWFPTTERGFAQGSVWLSARFMGGMTPFVWVCLTAGLGLNWRETLWVFSGVAMAWVAVFIWWFRDRPDQHSSTNAAERELILAGKVPPTGHAGIPWGRIFTNRNVWALCAMYMVTNFNWYFIMYNLPGQFRDSFPQLRESLGGQMLLGLLAGAPLLVGMLGCLGGGMLTDALIRKTGNRKWGRRTFAMIGYGMAGAFYLLATQFIGNLWPFAICLILVGLSNDFMMAPSWATAQDIGRRYSAIVSGAMNMVGNLGATLGIFITSLILNANTVNKVVDGVPVLKANGDPDTTILPQGYIYCFELYSGIYLLGVIAWLFIDASKPIPTDEELGISNHDHSA
ncbi:MFS transporter [Zavarzinella formosa]|uniref:MFS transporter n=1 Tax=Zavarzinella formosa TaxID=360055 RepID=UPI00037B70A5|nr:MFS transporter [Zavarzinella formosa]